VSAPRPREPCALCLETPTLGAHEAPTFALGARPLVALICRRRRATGGSAGRRRAHGRAARAGTSSRDSASPAIFTALTTQLVQGFLVTPDGIVLGDPISVAFATWLKGELDARFGASRTLRRLQPQPLRSREAAPRSPRRRPSSLTRNAAQHGLALPADAGRHVDRNKQRRHRSRRDAIRDQHSPGSAQSNNWFASRDYDGDGKIPPRELQREHRAAERRVLRADADRARGARSSSSSTRGSIIPTTRP